MDDAERFERELCLFLGWASFAVAVSLTVVGVVLGGAGADVPERLSAALFTAWALAIILACFGFWWAHSVTKLRKEQERAQERALKRQEEARRAAELAYQREQQLQAERDQLAREELERARREMDAYGRAHLDAAQAFHDSLERSLRSR